MVNVAIMGYGTVGSGVYEVIANTTRLTRNSDEKLNVKYILDIRDFPGLPHSNLFTKSFDDIVNDPEVDVVVEVMGGVNPAYDFTKRSICAGKHVVTSNKELVATRGCELLDLARKHNVSYLFEASVGGGIPIIRPLGSCLAANDLTEILGILNGTTNYILTKMINEGVSFDAALSEAQEKGYAERNPDADILGFDACRKIAILSSLASGKYVNPDKVHTEGITKIKLDDVEAAGTFGYVIKLIGYFKKLETGKVAARVSPMLIEKTHPLAGIEDVFNGIFVVGDSVGECMFYGRGAGKLPTASAVVADVIDISRNLKISKSPVWMESETEIVEDYRNIETKYFVLMKASEDTKNDILNLDFVDNAVCINENIALLTKSGVESELTDKINSLKNITGVASIVSSIRVL